MMRTRLAVLLIPALAACASATDSGSDPVEPEGTVVDARVGQTFRLRAGATARLDNGVLVFFRGATDDSRCPTDVQCVWAGDATLHLRAASTRRDTWTTLTLHTDVLPRSGDFDGRTLTVVDLAPGPRAGQRIATGDYVAILRVD